MGGKRMTCRVDGRDFCSRKELKTANGDSIFDTSANLRAMVGVIGSGGMFGVTFGGYKTT